MDTGDTLLSGRYQSTNGTPWWVKAISVFGVPAAIALYLTWVQVEDTRREQRAIRAEIALIKENLALHANDAASQRASLWQIEQQVQQVCVIVATDFVQRRACFGGR